MSCIVNALMMTVLLGLGPGDGVGGDGAIDHAAVGDSTLVECHFQGILFNLSREETMTISP